MENPVRVRSPEVVSGLGVLFRSLPLDIREVLLQCNLQRTGCLRCGIGPHHVYQCPHLSHETASEMEQGAYRRWAILIGEELMLYGASSSASVYKESALARMAARHDLPKRPPRRMRGDTASAHPRAQHVRCDSPLLPTPSNDLPPVRPADQGRPPAGRPLPIIPLAVSEAKPMAPPKPAAKKVLDAEKNAPKVTILKRGKETPESVKGKQTEVLDQGSPSSGASVQVIESIQSADDVVIVESAEEWSDNNVIMDISKLAKEVTRMVGDLEMLKARIVGSRRSRPFTPGSTDRPKKVARDSGNPASGHALDFSESTQEILEKIQEGAVHGSESQDMRDLETQSDQESSQKYEDWSILRYKRAKTENARGLFWATASEEAKERMIQALLAEPPGSSCTVQARQKLWIPF